MAVNWFIILLLALLAAAGHSPAGAQPTLHVWVNDGPHLQGVPVVVRAVVAQHQGPVQYFMNGRPMRTFGHIALDTLIPSPWPTQCCTD